MTEASARVICDSITEEGHRLTTFEAVCWRPMLAEQNTHCVLARNSASSRARSVNKVLDAYKTDFAWPIVWPSEAKGMQGGIPLTGQALLDAKAFWDDLRVTVGDKLTDYIADHPEDSERLHKSLLNRWMEIGMWQTQVITATQWDGYFWQRCHKDAEPHIQAMAYAIRDARDASTPELLTPGEWHLPYWAENGGHESDWADAWDLVESRPFGYGKGDLHEQVEEVAKSCSAARVARVSYLTMHGIRDLTEDLRLYGDLTMNRIGSDDPPHASPLEHICTPWAENVQEVTMPNGVTMGPLPRLGKMIGWLQNRHLVLGF